MAEESMTYLGQKGYTIKKNNICVKEQKYLRDELMVKPYMPKSPVQPPAFPIYRESQNKLYVPRFFGVETYGEPDEMKLTSGEPIHIEFKGSLRDYQINIVNKYVTHVNIGSGGGGGLLEIPCGRGKTVMALKIIQELNVKTLVIVHKGFLLDQWIERIEQFLPGARVGRIQGQNIDIENKDIVIGMLQSLSMKEYPQSMFSSFGLTIVDECHHISSEVFSRSLLKIVTKYVLGLSATMQRKDGLTRVFKMFLGEIIYKEKRDASDDVLVKALEYVTNDEEFNEMLYDYRGNPAYSTMISKLCTYNRRSEFIINVIKKELEIYPEQQIMILSQNKNLLGYLHKAITSRNIASIGYYVGGMKKEHLKESENKKIIIATYAMAAEALDIKSLTTLILATPRTDITQAVGRILRVKHKRPMVIDIVDTHQVFKKQWLKRKKFYEKNKYKTLYGTSNEYNSNDYNGDNLKVIYDPDAKKIHNNNKSVLSKGKCLIKL
jgi:superfamily II DNA or RNA helicase